VDEGRGAPWLSRSRHVTGAVIVRVAGRVEGAATVALNQYLHRCLDEHPAVLVVDLEGVEALDGEGLWVLYQVGHRAHRDKCEMRIAGATPATLRAVDAAAMIEDFRIYPTVAAALNLAITPQMPLARLDQARARSVSGQPAGVRRRWDVPSAGRDALAVGEGSAGEVRRRPRRRPGGGG
jgi:anti-anti-sigma factor